MKHYFRADGRPVSSGHVQAPSLGQSPSGLGIRSGEKSGVDTTQFSLRVSHTHTHPCARAHTHTRTQTHRHTHASTHTPAHPRTQARVRAAGSKLGALVRSLPSPPLGSSRGIRGSRRGTREVLGSGEAWAGPAFSPPQVLGRGPAAPGSRRSELNKAG